MTPSLSYRHLKSHLAIIAANTIHGLNYVIAKGIMPDFLAPRAVVLLRISGSLLLFWALHLFLPTERIERRDLRKIVLYSVFGVVLNQFLFFEGLNRTTPISASIITTGTPIFILVFSHFILKERVTGMKVFGILSGAAGALMIILSAGTGDFRLDTLLGNSMICMSNASWSLYLVMIMPLMKKYGSMALLKWLFLSGFLLVSPFSFGIVASSSFAPIPLDIWMAILFVVFATTGLAYCLINYSLKTVTPNINGIYVYLQPLVASIAAIALGKDTLTAIDLMAALLIMAGVYLISRRQGPQIVKIPVRG